MKVRVTIEFPSGFTKSWDNVNVSLGRRASGKHVGKQGVNIGGDCIFEEVEGGQYDLASLPASVVQRLQDLAWPEETIQETAKRVTAHESMRPL